MKRTFFLLTLAIIASVSLFGHRKMSNYTVLLLDNKKAEIAEFQNTPMGKTIKSVNGKEYADCFVHFVGSIDEAVLEEYGAQLHCRYDVMNMVTAAVPLENIEALANDDRIKRVEAGTPVKKSMNDARLFTYVDDVIAGTAPLSKSYLGRGIVVGVVDGDMQYDHPAFWNAAHNKFRIKRVWNQNKTGKTPSGFSYGAEYTDSATIITQKYDTKQMTSGHATHVAAIAVSADHCANYYGPAQEADIVFVSAGSYNSTALPDGIKYCFDYAKSVNKPCVVNVSMGSTIGSHDGTSTECQAINNIVGKGMIAVGSAGNSGDDGQHVGATLNGTTDTAMATFISYKSVKGMPNGYAYIDVYGDINQVYSIQFIVYNKDSKTFSYASTPLFSNSHSSSTYRLDTVIGSYGRLKCKMNMVPETTANGRGHISVVFNGVDSIPSRHSLGLRVVSQDSGHVNFWSYEEYSTFTNYNQTGFLDGDGEYTVDEPMGIADGVISVGSYVSYPRSKSIKLHNISSFSSHGPTADNRIKPDVTAPGEYIMSAYPDLDCIKSGRETNVIIDGKTYYYALMQGTSMASPFCAGVIATWLEANPELSPDDIRDVFRHTCLLDEYTGNASTKPDNIWGLGKINAYQGLLYILGLTTKTQDVSTTGVLVAYPNPTSDILNIGFPASDENLTVSIFDLSGKCVYSETLQDVVPGQNIELNVSSLANGAYIVKVAGQKTNDTFKLLKE